MKLKTTFNYVLGSPPIRDGQEDAEKLRCTSLSYGLSPAKTVVLLSMRTAPSFLAIALGLLLMDCTPAPAKPAAAATSRQLTLAQIAFVHGGAGPWVVAGYRMGEYALKQLELPRGSFDLSVVHESPQKVQFTCVADGAAAATGASAGKLNLSLQDASESALQTVYTKKSTGERVVLRPTAAFIARYKDVPRAELRAAGEQVMGLTDAEIFEAITP